MKILSIGDVHGYPTWKIAVEKHKDEVDKIVFVGDYVDSFENSPYTQTTNLEAIVRFKKENPDNVILLLGNHDAHYINNRMKCSGFNTTTESLVSGILRDGVKDGTFQCCYFENETLYSHAGVTKTWLANSSIFEYTDEGYDLAAQINELFINTHTSLDNNRFNFLLNPETNRYGDGYGDSVWQGPLWVRPRSLISDAVNFRQVVGHTTFSKVQNHESRLFFIDTPDTEFLIL